MSVAIVMDIYLAASRRGKLSLLATSTSVNNCQLLACNILVNKPSHLPVEFFTACITLKLENNKTLSPRGKCDGDMCMLQMFTHPPKATTTWHVKHSFDTFLLPSTAGLTTYRPISRFMEDVRHKATISFFFFKLANPP